MSPNLLFCGQRHTYITEKPKVGVLPLESQYLRDKCWVKRKVCFIQEASSLGRWWTNVQRTSLKLQTKQRVLKVGGMEEGGYIPEN